MQIKLTLVRDKLDGVSNNDFNSNLFYGGYWAKDFGPKSLAMNLSRPIKRPISANFK